VKLGINQTSQSRILMKQLKGYCEQKKSVSPLQDIAYATVCNRQKINF